MWIHRTFTQMRLQGLCLITIVSSWNIVCVQADITQPVDIVEQYNVTLVNSGPVFYGSNLTFTAQLYSGTSQVPKDSKYFVYEWRSTVSRITETQEADFKTSLTKCYNLADPDTYEMSLKVYNNRLLKRQLVASAIKKFTITDALNGRLIGSQHGKHVNDSHNFSTLEPVMVKLDIHDKFTEKPEYRYEWFLDNSNTSTVTTTFPSHQFTIDTPGTHTVKVKVHSENDVNDCSGFDEVTPMGKFHTELHMFVPVGSVQIVGKSAIKPNKLVTEEVYFNGSSPFNISWSFVNITTQKHVISTGKIVNMNGSSPITVKLNKTLYKGHYSFGVSVENAVSFLEKHHNFSVNERESPTHSAAVVVLPLIAGLVLMTLIVAAVYVVIPRWKGKHVETADFNFHPSLRLPSQTDQMQSDSIFKSVYKRLFGKSERECCPRHENMQRVGVYGSMEESVRT